MKSRLHKIATALIIAIFAFTGTVSANILGSATATASSGNAALAIDGDDNTRWESAFEDPQTLTITLDKNYFLSEVKIHWEAANAKSYTLEVSTDNTNWTQVYSTTTGGDGHRWDEISLSSVEAKYIKIYGTERNLTYGYSIWEVEAYEAVPTEKDATLSDIKVDNTSIPNFSSTITDYVVNVEPGTSVIPTVVATTSQTAATHTIVPATEIPGTTTITVKSSDESMTEIYNVEFKEQYVFATLDFEPEGIGANWAWEVGQNGTNPAMEFVANPSVLAPNTSATVAKFTAEDAGADWALVITEDVGDFTFDVEHAIVKVMVYKSVLSNVGVKFEGPGDIQREILVSNTKTNEWEELIFDFSDEIGKTYNKLVFIPDFAPRSQDNIVYWDNFTYEAGVSAPDPSGMAVLDFEPNGHGQDIRWSIFENGDGVSNLEFVANPSVGGVNSSANVAKLAVAEGSSGWVGAESKAPDVGPITWSSELKTIKMKVYSTVLTTVGLKMVPSSGGGGAHAPKEAAITEVNTWQEVTLDYTEFIGGAFAANMDIIVLHPNMGTEKGAYDIYFDDITFVEGSTALPSISENNIEIYTNNGRLHINGLEEFANGNVQVYNVAGAMVINTPISQANEVLDLDAKGIYLVRLSDKAQLSVLSQKVIAY